MHAPVVAFILCSLLSGGCDYAVAASLQSYLFNLRVPKRSEWRNSLQIRRRDANCRHGRWTHEWRDVGRLLRVLYCLKQCPGSAISKNLIQGTYFDEACR
jgi:hypothetical protein